MNQNPRQRIGYFPEQDPPEPPVRKKRSCAKGRKPDLKSRFERAKAFWERLNVIRLAVLALCVVVFCTCLFLLARYTFHIVLSRSASRQLETIHTAAQRQTAVPAATPDPATEPTATPAPGRPTATPFAQNSAASAAELWPTAYAGNPTLRVSSIFYQLQAQNEDIIGWLKIDGLLEEAVVQRDNAYYLTHNALKQKSVTGALFLDENCDLDTVPTQMVIHGHNMKEGAMFGSLKKYKVKDASYYREHPFIDFNTIYENGRYVIFSVAEVDIRSNKPDFLPFWHNARFASADAFMEYVNRAKLLSHYRCNVDVQPGDRLLTLSTCTGSDENKRLIIMARKLRENENELELNRDIYSTSDR